MRHTRIILLTLSMLWLLAAPAPAAVEEELVEEFRKAKEDLATSTEHHFAAIQLLIRQARQAQGQARMKLEAAIMLNLSLRLKDLNRRLTEVSTLIPRVRVRLSEGWKLIGEGDRALMQSITQLQRELELLKKEQDHIRRTPTDDAEQLAPIYQEALAAYDEVIRANRNDAGALKKYGDEISTLGQQLNRYETQVRLQQKLINAYARVFLARLATLETVYRVRQEVDKIKAGSLESRAEFQKLRGLLQESQDLFLNADRQEGKR